MSDDRTVAVDLAIALHRTSSVLVRALGEALPDATPAEALVLAVLADRGPTAVGELRADLGLRPSTCTSILDRLTERKRIVRQVRPDDRRSFLVLLTEAGRDEANQVAHRLDQLATRVGPGLGREALDVLGRLTSQLDTEPADG